MTEHNTEKELHPNKTMRKIIKLYDENGWTYRIIDPQTGEWVTYNEKK